MNLKWEYQLMRDMLERSSLFLSIHTENMQKTGIMLRQAASVMTHWDRKITNMELALTKIQDAEILGKQEMRQIAREAMATTEESSVDGSISWRHENDAQK